MKTISADGSRVARLRAPFNEEGEVEEEGDGMADGRPFAQSVNEWKWSAVPEKDAAARP